MSDASAIPLKSLTHLDITDAVDISIAAILFPRDSPLVSLVLTSQDLRGFYDLYGVPTGLQHLNLANTDAPFPRIYDGITRLINLTALEVDSTCVDDQWLEKIASSLPSIKTLNISFCHSIRNFESLQQFKHLTDLNVRHTSFSDRALVLVASNRTLMKLRMDRTEVLDIAPVLLCKDTLRKLECYDLPGMDDEGLDVVSMLEKTCEVSMNAQYTWRGYINRSAIGVRKKILSFSGFY
jgi:hypothetical protein